MITIKLWFFFALCIFAGVGATALVCRLIDHFGRRRNPFRDQMQFEDWLTEVDSDDWSATYEE